MSAWITKLGGWVLCQQAARARRIRDRGVPSTSSASNVSYETVQQAVNPRFRGNSCSAIGQTVQPAAENSLSRTLRRPRPSVLPNLRIGRNLLVPI